MVFKPKNQGSQKYAYNFFVVSLRLNDLLKFAFGSILSHEEVKIVC